jgi:hypothetical protein
MRSTWTESFTKAYRLPEITSGCETAGGTANGGRAGSVRSWSAR